jgi:hypothetical protein
MSVESIPPEIMEWVKARQDVIARALRRSRYNQAQEDPKRWVLELLTDLSTIETEARRAVHLLTTYASRADVARPTEVAVASHVTVTTVASRAGSRLAQDVWREVQP